MPNSKDKNQENTQEITQEKKSFSSLPFHIKPTQSPHSTDSSNQELHQAIKKTYEKSQAQFYVYLYNSNTFEPLSGVKVEYGGKEAVSDDEGYASFSFEISSPWDAYKIYPISILSPEYSSFSTYTCSMISSPTESKAYRVGLLKKAEMSYKDKTLMFDFSSYKVKEIIFPSKDLRSFGKGESKELEKDFFRSCFICKSNNPRNYLKIERREKGKIECVAYITYKREKLTYMDMGFILEERDYRHLCDALEKEDIDIYEFKDEGEYFYLKDISISSSFEGRSASNGVDDTLKLKANFSKNSSESKNTQWGYITFARGVQVQKELYALRKANTLPIEQVEGFEILKNEKGEEIKGEEISVGCLFEWRDRQVLIFGYTNTPSLANSILLLPTSSQKEDEEVLITSLESNNDEEYLKFSFPSNPTQNSQSLMQCDEFMVDDLLCSLQALSLKEEEEGKDDRAKSMDKESIKKYLKRFSKEVAEGKREVEFERELDDLFIHTSRNAKSTTSKINQNKSKVEEALLEDGTKVTRSRAYREFNKVEQKFLDSATLVQVEGKSVAQRTQVLDLGPVSMANMRSGKAPKGIDGEPMELHHLQQKEDGILIELTKTEHKENSKALHSYKKESEIDRVGFAKFKKKYWKARAEGLDRLYSEMDAKEALKIIVDKYGEDKAKIIEKIYRCETAHFTSKQYRHTGTGGMEAFGVPPYYGWDANFFSQFPHYQPIGIWNAFENQGLSNVGGNTQSKNKKKFVVMPSVLAGMEYKIYYINKYNGNWARWHSTQPQAQEQYKKLVDSVKPRFVEAIMKGQ